MEYGILDLEKLVISDGTEIRLCNQYGKRIYANVPNRKTFNELAYIHAPVTVDGHSFEDVLQKCCKDSDEFNTNQ